MDELFDLPPADAMPAEPERRGRPRLQRPDRDQLLLRPSDLESLLPADHEARLVWAFVESRDLSAFRDRIRAVEGHAGRPPIDPAILLALWLYATLEGVGSARALDRLCDEHDAYRWIAGGVSVNYHTLAEFRVTEAGLLEDLLVQSVAALLVTGEVTLRRVAHDGIRARASAGASSFRRRPRLEAALELAEAQVAALRDELDDDPRGHLASGPTAVASPTRTVPDLAWSPLIGLDLRGAFVAQGAVSGPITVLLGADTRTGALASWTSTDGAHWQRHWLDGSTFGGGNPQGLVAAGPGFVALGWNITPRLGTEPVVWTSPDGVDWQPDPDPSGHFSTGAQGIASTGSTIVVATCCDTTGVFGRPSFRTSTDGIAWVETLMPAADNAGILHLAANAGGYVATSLVDEAGAPGGTAPAAWRSTDGRTWVRDAALDEGLRQPLTGVSDIQGSGDGFTIANDSGGFLRLAPDGSVTPIEPPAPYGYPIGGPAGLAWLGTSDGGTCASAWVRAADTWRAVQTDPRGCAGPIQPNLLNFMTAFVDRGLALADGWLWVSPGSGTDGETAWAIRPANSVPVVDPPAGPAPVPPGTAIPVVPTGPLSASAPCLTGPVTIARVVALDANDRIACLDSHQLTFRAWVVDPGEGYGGVCLTVPPAWLQDCVLPDWLLASKKTGTGEIHGQLHALKRPGATGNLKGVSRWVNVTGHFDDPAAVTCRPPTGPDSVGRPPVGWFVLQCREQFVVTRIVTTQ